MSNKQVDISSNLSSFVNGSGGKGGIKPFNRYSSFDYCFNYFQSYKENGNLNQLSQPEAIHLSCLQLGFYLASWGMLRGSSFLLQRSIRVFEPVIKTIAQSHPKLWVIDADSYTNSNIDLILDFRNQIMKDFKSHGWASDILVTKIMLGVFGNVPAFDSQFKRGFGVSTFGRSALLRIGEYYQANSRAIDTGRLKTLDAISGLPTTRFYTRAKVIDMIFFIEGSK